MTTLEDQKGAANLWHLFREAVIQFLWRNFPHLRRGAIDFDDLAQEWLLDLVRRGRHMELVKIEGCLRCKRLPRQLQGEARKRAAGTYEHWARPPSRVSEEESSQRNLQALETDLDDLLT